MEFQRVYIKDAATDLGCSVRTFRIWCKNNDVGILLDQGLKKTYVLLFEYENAKAKSSIEYLSKKYGKDTSIEAVKSYLNIHSRVQVAKLDKKMRLQNSYQPTGEKEIKFLSSLTANESGI